MVIIIGYWFRVISNFSQDFIRQEAGNLGGIPPLVALVVDPNSDLETKESALKAIVNLALNCIICIAFYCPYET